MSPTSRTAYRSTGLDYSAFLRGPGRLGLPGVLSRSGHLGAGLSLVGLGTVVSSGLSAGVNSADS
jgi:hypothetical protein